MSPNKLVSGRRGLLCSHRLRALGISLLHQSLAVFNNFSPVAVTTPRSALKLGPKLAKEKVGEIKKSAYRKKLG